MNTRTITLDDRTYRYLVDHSVREHAVLAELREATATHKHSGMQIAPDQAQFMALLAKLVGARRAIEVGVFTGYSSLAIALALPADGKILACDISDEYTQVARKYWKKAGVEKKIELVLAPAAETLAARIAAGEAGTYDFAFIDADKTGYDGYYEQCSTLLRPGGLICVDNVLWSGAVARKATDADTKALQAFNDKVHKDERVDLAMVAVGDGVTLVRKR
jgi:caffeoyl-CoA O-methyltransferase